MKKATSLLTAALMGAALLTAGTATAQAATSNVTVKKIHTKTAPYQKTVTVKPVSSRKGNVSYVSQTLTVTKGKKTLAKNKKSINLKAGKYKVKTTVKYRPYKSVTKAVPQRVLAYKAGRDVPVTCHVKSVATPNELGQATFSSVCSGLFNGNLPSSGTLNADASNHGVWLVNGGVDSSSITLPGGAKADAAKGATYTTNVKAPRDLYRMINMPATARNYAKTVTKTLTQTLTIKQGKRSSRR